jgi:predicted Zn-dependent peptidase
MSHGLSRVSIGDRIHFNSVSDPKFKHNRMSVNLVLPLEKETASENAVVPFLLRKGCRECPDFSSLNARLQELYGAVLDADVTKFAGYQVLEISIRGLANRLALENEDVAGQCADLLCSVVLDPAFENGLFAANDVALERQYVIDSIEAEINEKRVYAVSQCIQTMCEGEPVAVRRYGYKELAEKITPESATNAYHRMLETAPIEIIFTGSGNPEDAKKVFEKRFSILTKRSSFDYEKIQLRTFADHVKEKTERMELNQSKMVLGMRTGEINTREELSAMRVCSALFGGTPFSKLFLNVREKLSLCYYCASRFDSSTKLLLVDSGVEAENKQKAQDEILRQLEAVKNGEFDAEELHNTKLLMKNGIRGTTDSLSSTEGWYLAGILRSQSVTPEEDTRNLDAVTREQVIAAAKGITLDTVYFLTGNEKEGK